MIHTLNGIADLLPAAVGFYNGNEVILYEYGIHQLFQIQNNGDDHGHNDDIKDIPPETLPERILKSL